MATGAHAVLELLVDAVGYEKLGVFGPAVIPFHKLYFFFAERFAVGFVGILFVRGAVADMAVHDDEGRLVSGVEESFIGAGELQQGVGVGDASDVPAVARGAGHHVFSERPTCPGVAGGRKRLISSIETESSFCTSPFAFTARTPARCKVE